MDALSSDAHLWAATNERAEKRCRFFRGLQGVSRLNIPTGADSNVSIVRIFLAENESLTSLRKILSANNTLVVVSNKITPIILYFCGSNITALYVDRNKTITGSVKVTNNLTTVYSDPLIIVLVSLSQIIFLSD